MSDKFFSKSTLNSPYEYPSRHWEMEGGQPTDTILEGRRSCELMTAVPKGKKQRNQEELAFEENKYNPFPIINQLRSDVEAWRTLPNTKDWAVSPETARLLQHWRQEREGLRPFFCQIEAVETAIWLAEVAPKNHIAIKHLQNANIEANPELFRIALKLATGAGKTTVMAMLIAWQTINAVRHPQSKNFTKGFLIITPGITIKDRLRVLMPNDLENYYEHSNIVPRDMLNDVQKAQIVITNYHGFIKRDDSGVSAGTKKFLEGHGEEIKTKENEGQMIRRLMPNLMGIKNIIVINDEAHHCYRKKPEDEIKEQLTKEEKEDAKKNDKAASLWISGIEAVKRKLGVRVVYDLSATPYFLAGSGYREGTLFPWTMSDFSLMDAIESGIVKLPRVPIIANDLEGMPKYRDLWQYIGKDMPKKGRSKTGNTALDPLKLPNTFNMALDSLYGHYEKTFKLWKREKVPPVFIIVCNNTTSSKLVYDYISGFHRENEDSSKTLQPSKFELFSNYDEYGNRYATPRTLLIDSEQLESDDALDKDFREMAEEQIEAYRRELRNRGETSKAEKLSDKDLLREAMNTVGKEGRLGADIRCVVSVAMLSEGWDANTVTHILGVRAFGTQLLCEQVVGRSLRRTNYDVNEQGLLEPQYADIFGIPFDFTSKATPSKPATPPKRAHIRAVEERKHLAITFPRVTGYRIALPDGKIEAKFNKEHHLEITPDYAESYEVTSGGIIGEQVEMKPEMMKDLRPSAISFELTKHLLYYTYRNAGEEPKFNLFSQFQGIVREWLDNYVSFKGTTHIGQLCYHVIADDACERIKRAIAEATEDKSKIEIVLDSFNSHGSTAHVNFQTTKPTYTPNADKSHINLLTYDANWEAELCRVIEKHPKIISYVKNQGLDFSVPYQMGAKTHRYYPDFILKIDDGREDPLNLVVEVKGYRKEDAKVKASTMNALWVPGMNQLGTFGRWAFAEFTDVWEFEKNVDELIERVKNG